MLSLETADSDIAAQAAREFFAHPQTLLVREEESRQVKNEKNAVTPLFSSEQINSGAVSIVDLGNGQLMLADGSDRQQVLTRHQFLQVYADADQALKLYASALEPSASAPMSETTSPASLAETLVTSPGTEVNPSATSADVAVVEEKADVEYIDVINFDGVEFDLAHFKIQIEEVFHDHDYDQIFKLSDGKTQLTLDIDGYDRFTQEYSGLDEIDAAIYQAWEAYEPSERALQIQKEDEESLVALQLDADHYLHFQLNRLQIFTGKDYYYAYDPLGGHKLSQEQIDKLGAQDPRFQDVFERSRQLPLREQAFPFDVAKLKITQKAPNYFHLHDDNYHIDVTRSQLEDLCARNADLDKLVAHEFAMQNIHKRLERHQHPEKNYGETLKYFFDPRLISQRANELPASYPEEHQEDHGFDFDTVDAAREIDFAGALSERLQAFDPDQVRERFGDDPFFQLVVRDHEDHSAESPVVAALQAVVPEILKKPPLTFDQDALEKNFYRLPPSQAVHFYGDSDFFRFCVQGNSNYEFFLAGIDQFMAELPARNLATKQRLQEIATTLQLRHLDDVPPEKRDEETLRTAVLVCDYVWSHIQYDHDFLIQKLSTVPVQHQFAYELYLGAVKGVGICTTYSYEAWQLLKDHGCDAILLGGIHEDPHTKRQSGHAFVGVRYHDKYYIFDPTNNYLGVSDTNYKKLYHLVNPEDFETYRDAYTILMTGKDAIVASGDDIPAEHINQILTDAYGSL